jgi:outer membrane lipoprotein-sorting protein
MSQYKFSAKITEEDVDSTGKTSVNSTSIDVVVHRPNQVRWEVTGSGSATYTGMYVGEEVIVSDGTDVFWYRPKLRQFTKTPIGPIVSPSGTVSAVIDHIEDLLFDGYKHLSAEWARVLGVDRISSGGSSVDCYVIEFTTPFQTAFTWWVDKERSVGLREVFELNRPAKRPTLTRRTEFAVAQIGGEVDAQAFVFSPPAGVKQVEAFTH